MLWYVGGAARVAPPKDHFGKDLGGRLPKLLCLWGIKITCPGDKTGNLHCYIAASTSVQWRGRLVAHIVPASTIIMSLLACVPPVPVARTVSHAVYPFDAKQDGHQRFESFSGIFPHRPV